MRRFPWLATLWTVLVYGFLYLPIVVLVIYSFNDSRMVTVWGGWTLRWYAEAAADQVVIDALVLSLEIAVATATASVVLGTCAAYALTRYRRFPGKGLFTLLLNVPLVLPTVVLAMVLLLFFVSLEHVFGFPQKGFTTLFIGHTVMCVSYAAITIMSRLREVDPALEEAAMDLGARPSQVFFLVTLPAIFQAVASAWLLTLSLSLDEVVISAFLSGPGTSPLPVVIFSRARLGLNPEINVIGAVTVYLVLAGLLLASVWMARRAKQRARENAALLRQAQVEALTSSSAS
ncbi:ABC transporter permease [Tepidiphilus thermophilus]|uniref:ABC-type spermidine/putrescine transport system, permease component II n=1 Tax=Tepidiphilus thermophilus TaxID=876478 RepID=A0A0K6IVT8_9PROT|nr:ABC transporter permease subunit [Tepidiphilus thermophilus]CUB07193.1 ABC-type spermidine/putrescine transport system, permease component II [Tepidiphilus thermophilus]